MGRTLSLRKTLWLLASAAASIAAPTAGPEYLITFGDSYSQTGFNPSQALPSASNPLGNPSLPGYTASGGLNWVGFLTSVLNTTETLTYNFASGGATTSASLVAPFQSTVLSLVDQVNQFTKLFSTAAKKPWTAKNTLIGVWIGVNDVGNSWGQSNENAKIASIMDVYFAQLQTIYDAGARNFVLLSVPPIYLTPSWLTHSNSDVSTIKTVISTYNSLLASRLTTFTAKNADVTAKIIDTNAPFSEAINNPTKYGAPNAACYNSNGKSCLWFNDYHPGISINKLVAQAVATAWPSFF